MIGFHKSTEPFEFDESKWFEHEKPSVLEAFRTLGKEGYYVAISGHDYDMRKKRLDEEYEKNTKAPGPGEEQPKEDNPTLKEAASQFNDSLLDEQAKKIEELTKKNEHLKDQITILDACKKHSDSVYQSKIKSFGKEIARLNGIIHKKNMKIEEFRKESSRHLRGKIKMFYENMDLEGKLKDKDAVLSDVAEELRLTKIREKNLTEVCQKYMKENEEFKKELADKVVEKIDAQALKSAESALAYKEKVITDLTKKLKSINMNRHNERIYKKQLAEKDEVISDLGKELAEAKKLNTAKILDFNAKCMRAAREFINDVFESYAAKYAKSSLDELKEKAYNSFNAKANKLGLVGSKDGNGILDRIEEDTHPTEDNPEEVTMDEILEHVRKALEEGGTVSISYDKAEEGGDQSATIVYCDNGITLSKEEAEIIERCTKNGTELHYSEKYGLTYTNVFGEEIPIRCLRGMFHVFTDEEIKNMKK